MDSAAGRSCSVHPNRVAVALCQHCSKPVCSQCALHAVAIDAYFCSEDCRRSALSVDQAKTRARPDRELVAGLQSPFATGIKLWFRSLQDLVLGMAPAAFLIGLAVWLGIDPEVPLESDEMPISDWAIFTILAALAYGMALAGVVLSQRHTGYVTESSFMWALWRLIPWLATWALVFAITVAGTLLFIIPGIYLGLRLFWADEYALIHSSGPIRALQQSWKLTENEVGAIFLFQFLAGLFSYAILIAGIVLLMGLGFVGGALGVGDGGVGFATGWTFLMGYALFHGPEVARFYGMRASKSERARRAAGKDAGPQFWTAD